MTGWGLFGFLVGTEISFSYSKNIVLKMAFVLEMLAGVDDTILVISHIVVAD